MPLGIAPLCSTWQSVRSVDKFKVEVGCRPPGGNVRYSALRIARRLGVGYRRRNRPAVGRLPSQQKYRTCQRTERQRTLQSGLVDIVTLLFNFAVAEIVFAYFAVADTIREWACPVATNQDRASKHRWLRPLYRFHSAHLYPYPLVPSPFFGEKTGHVPVDCLSNLADVSTAHRLAHRTSAF